MAVSIWRCASSNCCGVSTFGVKIWNGSANYRVALRMPITYLCVSGCWPLSSISVVNCSGTSTATSFYSVSGWANCSPSSETYAGVCCSGSGANSHASVDCAPSGVVHTNSCYSDCLIMIAGCAIPCPNTSYYFGVSAKVKNGGKLYCASRLYNSLYRSWGIFHSVNCFNKSASMRRCSFALPVLRNHALVNASTTCSKRTRAAF